VVISQDILYMLQKLAIHELFQYDYKDLISELIDNSLAARFQGELLQVNIDLFVDQRNRPVRLVIRDNAQGIAEDKLGVALSPAAIKTENSLNEHGLGMKQAIAGIGKLSYLATRSLGEDKARVVLEFKFGKVDCYYSEFGLPSGTEICIDQIKPIVSVNPASITMTLVPYLGARYRRFLRADNRIADISLYIKNSSNGNINYQWQVEEIKPIYFHPGTRTNKPVVLNKKFSGSGWKAEITFGYAPTEEELRDLGIDELPHYHPYKVSISKQGLDIILHDRVILFHQLSELGIVTVRHNDYNPIRGEIVLLEGFSTAITKNSIMFDEHFDSCIEHMKEFLSGKEEEGTSSYIRLKRYPTELPESLLRDRLANWLKNNPINKKKDVKTEYTIEGLAGNIDILADKEAWEIKRDQANGLDVYQLFAYMDMGNIDKGFLVASSFATGAIVASEFIKDHHGKEITIARRSDFPINHQPSEDERKEYY